MPQRDSCGKRACPAPVSQGAGLYVLGNCVWVIASKSASLLAMRTMRAPRGEMWTIFHAEGGGPQPAPQPRVRHPARLALIFILLLMAFAWGTMVAVAWDALSDMQARDEMDPTW
jgi:hypothetical protein